MSSGKKRSGGGLLLDLILTICTGGLWLIWILIRYLRNNTTDNVYHFDGGGDWIMRRSHDLAIVWQTKGRGDCREE